MRNYYDSFNIKFLTEKEFEELINAITIYDSSSTYYHRNLAIFLLAEYCALRVSEVGLLTLSDFDLDTETIFCRRLKGSVSNRLKIVDKRVLEALKTYYQERIEICSDSKYLFLSRNNKPINRRTLHNLMKFYSSFTKISSEKTHFHALKHTRAIELLERKNVDIRDVQWWLGHKYITNTMIYLNYSVGARESLYAKLKER